MNFEINPCFNSQVRHQTARVHLPVAARCNIQCKYCNRKYDCVNESRPGVTSAVLKPEQAITYLDSVLEKVANVAVIGIAGPGDPFATPEETLQTLELVRKKYPDKILCLATNGLGLPEYADRIAQLNVSHVTITLNAVEPEIGAEIYAWIRYKNRSYRGVEGAKILLERQLEAIRQLKERNITIKVNTVIIPGINDRHAVTVAEVCEQHGVDIQNCIPLMHVEGTDFEGHPTPDNAEMTTLRAKAGEFMDQMTHCARCRADAAGIVGQNNQPEIEQLLRDAVAIRPSVSRPNVAVATMEGIFVNRHLGEAPSLWIFGQKEDKIVLLEQRPTPPPGTGNHRWHQLADTFKDCAAVLVSGCGPNPTNMLEAQGLRVIAMEGLIKEALPYIFSGREVPTILLRVPGRCGSGCTGGGGGC